MKKKKQSMTKLLALILAALLIAALVVPALLDALVPAASAAVTQKDIDKGKANQKVYQEQKESLQNKIKQYKNQKANAIELKAVLDEKIEVIENEIANNNQLILDLKEQLAYQQDALDRAREAEKVAADLFRRRLRAMEEAGRVSYVSILFQSASFSDLLGRMELIGEIMDADQRVIENLALARAEIEEVKAQLEQDKADQYEVSKQLAAAEAELAEEYGEIEKVVAGLIRDTQEAEKAYQEAEKAEKQVQDEIKKMQEQLKKQQEAAKKSTQYVGGEYLFPVPGYTIGAGADYKFGMRYHPILKRQQMHTGVDIPAPRGTPIVAANGGTVLVTAKHSSYGNYVVVDHGGGQATLYAHMSKIGTGAGKEVKRGETIGYVGSTGLSTGDHLHFEIIINGKQVNPEPYLKGK